ncbi:MAG TPA: formylglycine-generating enzyme family protein [Nitrospiria bacterium]|jgi:formylglycine-generating enzyme required for sulfatase activity|nr:formylglycine-generating enzyme family protein [Nitrospiria bacterium]
MSKYLIGIYLALVIAILVIIQIGIRQKSGPHEPERQETEQGYTPLATKLAKVEEESRKAELEVKQAKIGEDFESMVFIPAGEFFMGSNDGSYDAKPVRMVYLDGFSIDKYEVTFAQFYQFIGLTGHRKPRLAGYLSASVTEDIPLFIRAMNPVVGVSWDDAVEYCQWKGKRLPSEAEWEKAAKGTDKRKWPWGNEERSEYANLLGDDGAPYTAPVNQFRKDVSPYGVYDLAGNAMEWVADWFNQDSYRILPVSNPLGVSSGESRVIRGASWNDSIKRAQTSIRFKMSPEYRDVTIGFRCAKSGSPP